MRRFATAITLALLALVLTASITMAAPRVAAKTTTIDAGLDLSWFGLGVLVDINQPLNNKMGLRFTVEPELSWVGYFGVGASASVMYPISTTGPVKFALYAGPQAGFESYMSSLGWAGLYVGGQVGVAAEYVYNKEWSFYAEVAYAPGVIFYLDGWDTPGYYGTGGWGFYAIWKMDPKTTLNFGSRSIGWMPGFFVGLTF